MNLPRGSYYYHPKARETSSEQLALTDRIEGIAEEFPRYGYRKVTAQLRREGVLGVLGPPDRIERFEDLRTDRLPFSLFLGHHVSSNQYLK